MPAKLLIWIKILAMLAFSGLVIFVNEIWQLAIFGLFLSVLSYKLAPQKFFKRLKILSFAAVLIIIFNLLVFSRSFETNLLMGSIAGIRLIIAGLGVLCFTSLVSFNQLLIAFNFLPATLQLFLTITFSLVSSLEKELQTVVAAQKARGHKTSWWNLLHNFLPLTLPLINRTLTRSERIAIVMESRGWEEKIS